MKLARMFALLIVFFILSAIHLSIYTNSNKVSYEINDIKKKWDSLRNDTRYLNYVVAKEESLSRIEKTAKGKLKMEYPSKMNYIVVSGESH